MARELTYLQANLHPVQSGGLEELGGFEGAKEALAPLVLGRPVVQPVEHIHLQQLLVAHPDLHRVGGRAVLLQDHATSANLRSHLLGF